MLHRYCIQFLAYCQLVDFSARSIQALTIRLNEFESYLKSLKIRSIKKVAYRHLIDFTADYNIPSIHVTKSRVWTLRQLYHFLTLHRIVTENIATGIPYPKIEKTVPQFLTIDEYNRWFCVHKKVNNPWPEDSYLLVHFQAIDVGEESEPFRVSSRSLPNSITWAAITYFAINQSPLIKLFDIMLVKLHCLLAIQVHRWHNLKAVCNEAAAKNKGGASP